MPEVCACCGFSAPPSDGDRDPYGAATPSCWAAFGRLLEGDYSRWQPRRHRLTVDAYMAQHPAVTTPSGRRSVLVHLIGLWLTLERNLAPAQVGPILGKVFPDKRLAPPELAPIPPLSGSNLAQVLEAEDQEARVEAWARFVWEAWRPHHPLVMSLALDAQK
jgi:hypothetical protein